MSNVTAHNIVMQLHEWALKWDQVIDEEEVASCHNGTGYFDAITYQPYIQPGEVHAFTAAAPDSRRGVVIGIAPGIGLALFERYTPETGSIEVIVGNRPDPAALEWTHWPEKWQSLGGGAADVDQLQDFLQTVLEGRPVHDPELQVLTDFLQTA